MLMIPSNTLLFRAEGLRVGVVRGGNRVQLVPVTIGKDAGATVEISSGLTTLPTPSSSTPPTRSPTASTSTSARPSRSPQPSQAANELTPYHSGQSPASACSSSPAAWWGRSTPNPTTPMSPSYKENAPELFKENSNWSPAQPADAALRGEWWTIFNDSELNILEPQVATTNQDLKAAEARFRQARAQIRFKPRQPCANHLRRALRGRSARLGQPALHQSVGAQNTGRHPTPD